MALFHLHVTQIDRSAGSSVMAAAAYRAGEKLYSEYYGETNDYSRRRGVVLSDILLPDYAPAEYKDRATLWNALEKVERRKDAQLAYSFDIAMQNELTMEENIELAQRFLKEQFVAKGMIVDYAVHLPDKKDGIQNPHFHVLCPIRPVRKNGKWGYKQHTKYRLDENGNRIIGANGKTERVTIPTTDWGSPETLEAWRKVWADMVNAKFEEKGLNCRIDHRSNERRGLEEIPTVHEGVAVRQMEARGIKTDKGELNRWIKSTNMMLTALRKKIAALLSWIAELKERLSRPQPPTLADLLNRYYTARNAGAWSQRAKINNLKEHARIVNLLSKLGIFTVEDLRARVEEKADSVDKLRVSVNAKSKRAKELNDRLNMVSDYAALKTIFDEMNAIKWKGRREKFRTEHDSELRRFYMVRRKLNELCPDGKYPEAEWKAELAKVQKEREDEYARFKAMREEMNEILKIQHRIDDAARQMEQERNQTRTEVR